MFLVIFIDYVLCLWTALYVLKYNKPCCRGTISSHPPPPSPTPLWNLCEYLYMLQLKNWQHSSISRYCIGLQVPTSLHELSSRISKVGVFFHFLVRIRTTRLFFSYAVCVYDLSRNQAYRLQLTAEVILYRISFSSCVCSSVANWQTKTVCCTAVFIWCKNQLKLHQSGPPSLHHHHRWFILTKWPFPCSHPFLLLPCD